MQSNHGRIVIGAVRCGAVRCGAVPGLVIAASFEFEMGWLFLGGLVPFFGWLG